MTWKSPKGELLYRIGDVIISTNAQNPSSFFGGTWQLLCPGRTLVCVDTSQNEFNTVKKTGGSKTHTLTLAELPVHNHTASSGINSIGHTHTWSGTSSSAGAHVHSIGWSRGYNWKSGTYNGTAYDKDALGGWTSSGCKSSGAHTHSISGTTSGQSANHTHSISIGNVGSGYAHNNLQPFMAVYMWVRIA